MCVKYSNDDTLFVQYTTSLASMQGRRKQSPDGQASLMSVVKLLIIRAQSAAKIWALVLLAVRRRSHCASAKFSHTERKSYACAL